ncbi:peptidoglycan -binding protein [Acidisphaera sp. S103]|uniref:peptidoglycan -binding protein n=1 Tax=Acidisphaera sp. S103 TaxID=1747223 RepID=UPI00131A7E0E|nr:peptidoglycan -binding protein [Acidisphaera sp. S103]
MPARIRRHGGNGLDAWPGYVDALSTLLMVIIFVLLVFVLAQAFLTVALSGRSHELDKANQQLSALADELSLERGKSSELQVSVSQLSQQLAASAAARDKLTSQVADANLRVQAATVANTRLQSQVTTANGQANAAQAQLADAQNQLAEMKKQIADLDRTVSVDKDTLQAKLSDLATLTNEAKALAALRDELEKQAQDAAANAMTEQQRRQAVELQLGDEKKFGDSARAQIALLNQQIEQLKNQLSSIAATLDVTQKQSKDKDVQIANLGQKLNVALAAKVEELQQYRSEFFGKLRTLLANRSGITIVGDRFVFQSEVLFPVGSADLSQAGVAQMTTLAVTIKDIATEIPPDLHWVLRVDGHTDPQPVKGGQFASNWELSAERAITVVKLLIADGVPAEHLAATAFGEYQPFGTGDTPDAYAKDRRIELRLTDR